MDSGDEICPNLISSTVGLTLHDDPPSRAELLPPELWELIFRPLSAAELLPIRLTCRRWLNIVTNSPVLLAKFSIRIEGSLVLNRTVDLSNVLPAAKVYIGGIRITQLDSWWPGLAKRLVALTLDNCELTLPTLSAMLAQTSNLRKLKLNSISSFERCEHEEVNFRLDKLEKLAVGWVDYEDILEFCSKLCSPRLKTFHVHGVLMEETMERRIIQFMEAVQDSLEYIGLCPTGRLLEKISALKRLKLRRIQFGKCDFSTDQLVEFCRMNPTIEYVQILELSLSSETLNVIGSHLPALRRLWVTCQQERTIVPTFLRHMKGLEFLFLYGTYYTDQTLDFTGYEAPFLEELSIFRIATVQSGLRQFLQKSTKIRYLTIENGKSARWPDVFNLVEPLENLRELVLFFIEIDETIDEKCPRKQFHNLKSLTISHCKIPNDILFKWIGQSSKLEELWLTALNNVDEAVMLTILKGLPKLRVLKVAACDDSAVAANVTKECSERGIKLSYDIYA
ncbi:uncharacterized protein LOC119766713 [Culex quinquefasciatus]|uniref:uncharacterized protein LOC119766713 n=1 Tax=Culex quinquefasciatus TaxID=7176 RepID=UPI00016D74DA|nr:uncharacterized protein LOC119766713 [Culex quinquefasciatus]